MNCYYKLWIIIFGSFFALSLCHLLPKADILLAGARDGEERTGRPWYLECFLSCVYPFLPWPRPAAPHHSNLWGYPERMPWGNEQQTLPWEAAFMPPLPPTISLPREPFLARHVQILCLLTVRPSSRVNPQSGLGEVHFPALERPSMDSFTSCGMKEGRSSAARASSPCMLYLWKLGAGQQA